MLLRMTTWEKIRAQFSDAEKTALNEAITGQVICPRGAMVDTDRLPLDLADKLSRAVREAR